VTLVDAARILIAEDEAISAMWLEMELTNRGHTVLGVVASGAGAVQVAAREEPDVVLMDIRLAGPMDGIQAARTILAARRCAIIFMSGYSDQLVRVQSETGHAAGYLSKPIRVSDLERLLAAVT